MRPLLASKFLFSGMKSSSSEMMCTNFGLRIWSILFAWSWFPLGKPVRETPDSNYAPSLEVYLLSFYLASTLSA